MSGNTEKATAGRNLIIYAALVAVVAAYTVMLRIERPHLESYRYPTGLGGEVYDLEAHPLDPDRAMATLAGVAYFHAVPANPESWRDRYMAPVVRDDDDEIFFYRTSSEIGGGGEDGNDLYIKLASDQYIKVSPRGTNQ